MYNTKDMKKLEKTIKAFGNISRLKILQYLKKNKFASVVDIAKGTKCSYKAISKHLSILYRVDVVDREQVGYAMHYKLSDTMDQVAISILRFL